MFQRRAPLLAGFIAALLLVVAGAVPVTAQVPAAAASRAAPAWPHTTSDLKPEAGIVFGVLPNGLRYAIQRNTTPTNTVSMRMMVNAGSMHERPGEEGVAHLLEHMAFRGSTHIPDGEILGVLSSLGMRLGPDANAGTSSLFTRYILDLPKNEGQAVDVALLMMREFASELSLSPATLDAERPVVVAEERARGGAEIKLLEELTRAQIGDHPMARPTIGSMDVVRNAPASRLRGFYDAYYRPERTTLVIVGDVDPADVEARINRRFADWRGRGEPGGDPAPAGAKADGPPVQMRIVPGSPGNGVKLIWRHAYRPHDTSRAAALRHEVEALGQQIMAIRLRDLNEAAGQPFLSADPVAAADIPGVSRASSMEAHYINNLPKTVDVLIRAQRQIAEQGVTQVELDRALANRKLAIQNLISETPTRETPVLVENLLGYALSGELPITPSQRLALLEEAGRTVTPAQVNAALRAHFEGDPTILYYGATEPVGGQQAFAAAVAQARGASLGAYAAANVKPWRHTDFGPAGRVIDRQTREDIGVTLVKFANGVRLTVKPTSFTKENVLVKVRFGYGQLHLPKNALTAADFATTILNGGGLTDMTRSEESASLAGKQVMAIATQSDDAYEYVNPSGVPTANLDLQMQLFAARFSRAGYRTDDWAVTIRSGAEADRAVDFDPERVYNRVAPPLLHSGDIRWEASTPEQHVTWDPKDAVAFIKPILETYPLEVIMVGDVTVDQAIAATAKTLGALPPRRQIAEPADLRHVRFPPGTPTPIDIKHKGRADQALLIVHWPAADALANPRETQAASMLSGILGSRVSHELRNAQGQTYSPHAYDALTTHLPGYGAIGVEVTLQPKDIPGAFLIIDTIAMDLALRGPAPVEFQAALTPQLEGIRKAQQDNRYWFSILNGAHDKPALLDLAANQIADARALTPEDIRSVARKWLVSERAWKMTITPERTTQASR